MSFSFCKEKIGCVGGKGTGRREEWRGRMHRDIITRTEP